MKELQQQQENNKCLTNSFSFNDFNLDFDYHNLNIDRTNKNDKNSFILPEDLMNTIYNNDYEKNNEIIFNNEPNPFNIDLEPEIFRLNEEENPLNQINNNLDNIPLLNENSFNRDQNIHDHNNRSLYPWNIASFQTPNKNSINRINSYNGSSSNSTRSSMISFGSNFETPTKKNRRFL